MSVTFSMPDAPTQRVQPYPEDEPDFWVNEPVPPFLEINVANGNAVALMEVLDPGADWVCGEWNTSSLIEVRRRILYAMNTKQKDSLVTPTVEHIGFGPRMVVCGRDEDYVSRRLSQFLDLTKVALEHGFKVTWG